MFAHLCIRCACPEANAKQQVGCNIEQLCAGFGLAVVFLSSLVLKENPCPRTWSGSHCTGLYASCPRWWSGIKLKKDKAQ